jgi:hypothetical protein
VKMAQTVTAVGMITQVETLVAQTLVGRMGILTKVHLSHAERKHKIDTVIQIRQNNN